MESCSPGSDQQRVTDFKNHVVKIASGASLTQDQAFAAFTLILEGKASAAQLGAFLIGMRIRGETIDEIIGATKAMRQAMIAVSAPPNAIDLVGTGGDGLCTYNISTLAAIIAAAGGAIVAKHGGKASSSLSGASDVLSALGVRVGGSPAAAVTCLNGAGICFMAGPTHHPALLHAASIRKELGARTIFNLLAPLCNPARVERQVLGVYSRDWLLPLAQALKDLGAKHVWLLHGSDGLDEATTTGPTHVVALKNGNIRSFDITPEEVGLPRASSQSLKGGDPAFNAKALRAVLAGEKSAYRDIAILNAAIALVVADCADTIQQGAILAAKALDSGAAADKLAALIQYSNSNSP